MRGAVRTVLGDVAPAELGVVDYHDHLFQITPLLPAEELDDEQRSREEAGSLVDGGVGCLVEATPIGLGRQPSAVARISRSLGLHVVQTTGVHREAHYPDQPEITAQTVDELAAAFRSELIDGVSEHRVLGDIHSARAGLIKVGIGYWSLTPFERRAVAAAGAVSGELGAPVMVHLEYCSAAHEVLTMLADAGCPPDRVALAHADRNPDPGLHLELAERGAYLGYDGCARHKSWPDSVLIDCLEQLVAGGGGDRVLLGGDVARRSRFVAYGGMPGLDYTFRRFLPRVRAAIGDEAADRVTKGNPARWLAWKGAPES